MLTVACVLRSGGDYTPEYVERLQQGVAQHLTVPHRFVCLSDVEVPCERIPLITSWAGWWAKLELFRPGLFTGPVLYFDLDTVITGDITPLAERKHSFTMLSDFSRAFQPASGVMAWQGDYSRLFTQWDPQLERQYRRSSCWGDQGWIARTLNIKPARWQQLFPGMFASYKLSPIAARKGASIVCFHGKPRPRDVNWTI